MQEDFLHYIWKHKKFDLKHLKSESGEIIHIVSVGKHNLNSGPDFFNAKLKIGDQLWAGNVEIHVKSSDWFLHNHEQDNAYDNVILHVVWEHDTEVFRRNNSVIPTLVLKSHLSNTLINNYLKLFNKQNTWINCEHDFANISDFTLNNWLERLYFERLERKATTIETLLKTSNNDWEAVLFKMLAKNFGLKVNGDAFLSVASSIDFSIIRKSQSSNETLEALLFGQAGLLNNPIELGYYKNLAETYTFLKQKFQIENRHVLPMKFFRLRPPNFPTIRLSQLARLYYEHHNLFSEVIATRTLNDFYKLFKVQTSSFWETHYTFEKTSKKTIKNTSKPFIDLLLINTILPIKFCYAKYKGEAIDGAILELINQIKSEKNSTISAFDALKPVSRSAMHSQALIQLKTAYCDKNKCLQCAVGSSLMIDN